jgi:hypothetical protein
LFHHAQGLTAGVLAFADNALPSYDAEATAVLLARTLTFLAA